VLTTFFRMSIHYSNVVPGQLVALPAVDCGTVHRFVYLLLIPFEGPNFFAIAIHRVPDYVLLPPPPFEDNIGRFWIAPYTLPRITDDVSHSVTGFPFFITVTLNSPFEQFETTPYPVVRGAVDLSVVKEVLVRFSSFITPLRDDVFQQCSRNHFPRVISFLYQKAEKEKNTGVLSLKPCNKMAIELFPYGRLSFVVIISSIPELTSIPIGGTDIKSSLKVPFSIKKQSYIHLNQYHTVRHNGIGVGDPLCFHIGYFVNVDKLRSIWDHLLQTVYKGIITN